MRTGTDWLAGAEAGSASGSLARSVTSRPELRKEFMVFSLSVHPFLEFRFPHDDTSYAKAALLISCYYKIVDFSKKYKIVLPLR